MILNGFHICDCCVASHCFPGCNLFFQALVMSQTSFRSLHPWCSVSLVDWNFGTFVFGPERRERLVQGRCTMDDDWWRWKKNLASAWWIMIYYEVIMIIQSNQRSFFLGTYFFTCFFFFFSRHASSFEEYTIDFQIPVQSASDIRTLAPGTAVFRHHGLSENKVSTVSTGIHRYP